MLFRFKNNQNGITFRFTFLLSNTKENGITFRFTFKSH
jgi:hypothetical protein